MQIFKRRAIGEIIIEKYVDKGMTYVELQITRCEIEITDKEYLQIRDNRNKGLLCGIPLGCAVKAELGVAILLEAGSC